MPRYYLNQGDLCQMIDQKIFLKKRGFDIEDIDIYATVGTKEEYVKAIESIYRNRVNGWWNYKDTLVANAICTAEEFQENLRKSVER